MRRSALESPCHFQALDPEKPIECFRRHLPHWRQEGATYFVTFRLSDSVPSEIRAEIAGERDEWLRQNPEPLTGEKLVEYSLKFTKRIETLLDAGNGSCALSEPRYSRIVEEALEFFDGERYHLFSWVVMPNHVHCVVRPIGSHSLDEIWESWKGFTSNRLTKLGLELRPVWFRECYDRIIRDAEHLHSVISYILKNPEKAGLERASCPSGIHKKVGSVCVGLHGRSVGLRLPTRRRMARPERAPSQSPVLCRRAGTRWPTFSSHRALCSRSRRGKSAFPYPRIDICILPIPMGISGI